MSALSPATLVRIREIAERRLTADEVRASLAVPIGPDEEQRIQELIRWFTRRYPTGAERLAYVRRAYWRWTSGLTRS